MTYPLIHDGRTFTPDGEVQQDTWLEYRVTLRHDAGTVTLSTAAPDSDTAVRLVMAAERCPRCAVVSVTQPLNCGHAITPVAGVAGFAFILGSYTVCYPCMTDWERSFFADANVFTGYLSAGQESFTTWTGGELARVTHVSTSRPIYTPTGGRYRRVTVRAVAPDGSRWHGTGSDAKDLITLRRSK